MNTARIVALPGNGQWRIIASFSVAHVVPGKLAPAED